MVLPITYVNNLIFPVVTGESAESIKLYGTCFYLGDNYFMTARHVIENSTVDGEPQIGLWQDNRFYFYKIKKTELIQELDIAIIEFDKHGNGIKGLKWSDAEMKMLDNVHTTGFPHGLNKFEEESRLAIRSYKGYVVSVGILMNYYELSFNCPRGISGAPLVDSSNGRVAGVIIGNDVSKINVCTIESEINEDGNSHTYTEDESVYFGKAITSRRLLEIKSKIIGAKLEEYLKRGELVL